MGQIRSIRHVGIYVQNLDRMVDFYEKTIGFYKLTEYQDTGKHLEKILGVPDATLRICKLLTPFGKKNGSGDMLELIQYVQDEPDYGKRLFAVGTAHIELEVGDILQTYEQIIHAGGLPLSEPVKVQESGNYLAFCRDPEGNYLELIQNG